MRRAPHRAILFALLAGSCGAAGSRPAPEPPFPRHVGAFELVEPPYRGRNAITAGYQLLTPSGPVIATVQRRPAAGSTSLVPALDIGRGEGDEDALADAAIARSTEQVRRFYPEASASAVRPFLVFRGGAMRSARGSTVEYRELIEGKLQPVRMQIDVVCCTAAHELVEYRFRHAADLNVDAEASEFLREFPWTDAEVER